MRKASRNYHESSNEDSFWNKNTRNSTIRLKMKTLFSISNNSAQNFNIVSQRALVRTTFIKKMVITKNCQFQNNSKTR